MRAFKCSGFTLLELLTVMGIIGVIAAIAIPNFLFYRYRSFDTVAISDIKNAYSASQIAFNEDEGADLTASDLQNYGFQKSQSIEFKVIDGKMETLQLMSYHTKSNKTFYSDAIGAITHKE